MPNVLLQIKVIRKKPHKGPFVMGGTLSVPWAIPPISATLEKLSETPPNPPTVPHDVPKAINFRERVIHPSPLKTTITASNGILTADTPTKFIASTGVVN